MADAKAIDDCKREISLLQVKKNTFFFQIKSCFFSFL